MRVFTDNTALPFNNINYLNIFQTYLTYSFAGKHEQWQYKLLGFEVSLWSCLENCEYKCQWKTVEAFQRKNWSIPQFRGKWPFIRFFGLQEPASVFFSVINFFVVLKLLFLFRKKVPKKTQYYRVWNIFGLVRLSPLIVQII